MWFRRYPCGQTHRHTGVLITILRNRSRGRSNYLTKTIYNRCSKLHLIHAWIRLLIRKTITQNWLMTIHSSPFQHQVTPIYFRIAVLLHLLLFLLQKTRSSGTAEGLRDAVRQLNFCQLLHRYAINHICKACSGWMTDGQPENIQYRRRHCLVAKAWQTGWLYCVEWHNTAFDTKRSPICAQAVYFLHSTMPSVTFLRLTDVSVICRVILIFSFQFSLLFFHISRQAARRRIGIRNMGYRT